jgi:glycosyltransferase involved in cell wall biosynthesis
MRTIKICHLTSVHLRYDTRIFLKECKTLSDAGFEVNLIVADGKGDEVVDKIKIYYVGKPINRKERMLKTTRKVFEKALEVNAEIYHFHDPELIPIGMKLKKLGKRVIYDVHEDVPRDILSKPYLNKFSKLLLSKIIEIYENYAAKKFDYIITATPYIKDRFKKLNPNTIDINNFPLLNEFYSIDLKNNGKNAVCYIGGISSVRGIVELIKSLEYVDTILHLAGEFESEKLKKDVENLNGWKKIKYYGYVNREKVREIFKSVSAGIVNYLPEPNHVNAMPNKLFEYMSASLPVIASNFPLWKEIVEKNNCGVCVDPTNPEEIAKAIEYLITHPDEAREMGENGRKAVLEKYNWEKESEKLLEVYKKCVEY